ncbi:MAG: hypothetical protein WCK20_03220 [Thermoleophilia bacterium]
MPTIQRDALHAFIDRQLLQVESTPVPNELQPAVEGGSMTADEVHALWMGAGIASQIGMSLVLDPSRFVEPWPEREDEAA